MIGYELQDGNIIDTNNTTSTPIGVDVVFTGVGTDVSEYNNVTIQLYSDKDSAENGIQFQFSTDNTNWDDCFNFHLVGGESRRFQYPVTAQYFRVVFTNGDEEQTELRIQTILHNSGILTTIHRISDSISSDNSAQLIKAIISGEKPNGDFVNVGATAGGNVKTSVEEFNGSTLAPLGLTLSPSFALATDHYDENTRALTGIDISHNKLHEGDHYYFDFTSGALNSTDTYELLVVTPNTTKWSHLLFDIQSPLGITFEIFEGTDSTGGTSITAFNNNRNSVNTSGMTITHTPVITTAGTLIKSRKAGTSTAAFRTSGLIRDDNEFIAKQNTKYLIRITSNVNSNYVSGSLFWYEHTNLSNS